VEQILRLSPKAREIFLGSFWSILGALFSKGLIFIAWIVVARILGSDGYGQFGIVRSTILMFTTFSGFSLGLTASKFVAELKETNKERTGKILGLTISFGFLTGIVVGLLFYFAAPWLALKTLHAPEISGELQIGSLILFFSAINGAQFGALQGFQAFKKIAIIYSWQAIVSFPIFILGAYFGGVNGSIWAYAISTIFICILSYYSIKTEVKKNMIVIHYRRGWEERSLLISYSLPSFLSGLMVSPIKWAADAILVSQAGFGQMGILAAAFTFQNLILMGANMLDAPFIAVMAKNKGDDIDSLFSKMNILIPWIIGIVVALPFMLFPELASAVFGKDYAGHDFHWTFVIVSLFTVIILFKQGLARILAVFELQWWGFLSNIIWGATLLGSFSLIKRHDSFTLAVSYLIAYFVNTIIIMPLYFKKKLVPIGTIFSGKSLFIWLLILISAITGLLYDNIAVKIAFLLLIITSLYFTFKKLIKT